MNLAFKFILGGKILNSIALIQQHAYLELTSTRIKDLNRENSVKGKSTQSHLIKLPLLPISPQDLFSRP